MSEGGSKLGGRLLAGLTTTCPRLSVRRTCPGEESADGSLVSYDSASGGVGTGVGAGCDHAVGDTNAEAIAKARLAIPLFQLASSAPRQQLSTMKARAGRNANR